MKNFVDVENEPYLLALAMALVEQSLYSISRHIVPLKVYAHKPRKIVDKNIITDIVYLYSTGVNVMPSAKQALYKTAYSPLFECYVRLVRVYDDEDGVPIFVGENEERGLSNHLFRESELTDFCL